MICDFFIANALSYLHTAGSFFYAEMYKAIRSGNSPK